MAQNVQNSVDGKMKQKKNKNKSGEAMQLHSMVMKAKHLVGDKAKPVN